MENGLIVIDKTQDELTMQVARIAAALMQEKGLEPKLLTIDTGIPDIQYQSLMREVSPRLLVTVNCAGFHLNLIGNDLFYNVLSCPAKHILLDRADRFASQLNHRMNFNVQVYTLDEKDVEYVRSHFERVPECRPFSDFSIEDADIM